MFRVFNPIKQEKVKLDVKDKKILVLLSEDARMPISEIAKKTQLSRDTVAYRIKRMHAQGVIICLYPNIDFKKLGLSNYYVFLLVDEKDKEKSEELIEALKNHPNTVDLIAYSDQWDLEWVLLASSIEEFDRITTDALNKFSSIILEKSKMAVVSKYYSTAVPDMLYKKEAGLIAKQKKANEHYTPDKTDLRILCAMANDCRQSTYELSKKVGISPDTVGLRIKKLVNSGIIKQFTVLANPSALNYSQYLIGIQVSSFDKHSESKFQEFMNSNPNIIKAVKTLGAWDVLIYVVAETPEELHKTLKSIKAEFSHVVKAQSTFVAYKEHVFYAVPKMLGE